MRTIFVLAVLLLSINSANSQSLTICSGQYEATCKESGAYDVFCSCCDVHAWAKNACKVQGSSEEPKYQMVRLLQKRGNKCGYEIWRATCR